MTAYLVTMTILCFIEAGGYGAKEKWGNMLFNLGLGAWPLYLLLS